MVRNGDDLISLSFIHDLVYEGLSCRVDEELHIFTIQTLETFTMVKLLMVTFKTFISVMLIRPGSPHETTQTCSHPLSSPQLWPVQEDGGKRMSRERKTGVVIKSDIIIIITVCMYVCRYIDHIELHHMTCVDSMLKIILTSYRGVS